MTLDIAIGTILFHIGSILGQWHQLIMAELFNCEIVEHGGLGPPVADDFSLLDYSLKERHLAIPVLEPEIYHVGISSTINDMIPRPWQHQVIALEGGALTIQEACMMATDRKSLGIQVKFAHMRAVAAVATGSWFVCLHNKKIKSS